LVSISNENTKDQNIANNKISSKAKQQRCADSAVLPSLLSGCPSLATGSGTFQEIFVHVQVIESSNLFTGHTQTIAMAFGEKLDIGKIVSANVGHF
jgi:hypothetical protein